jgi:hypothetical protein
MYLKSAPRSATAAHQQLLNHQRTSFAANAKQQNAQLERTGNASQIPNFPYANTLEPAQQGVVMKKLQTLALKPPLS